jgi:hypothetical protein
MLKYALDLISILQGPLAKGVRNIRPRIQILDCTETKMPRQNRGVQECPSAGFLPSFIGLCIWPASICWSGNYGDPAQEV